MQINEFPSAGLRGGEPPFGVLTAGAGGSIRPVQPRDLAFPVAEDGLQDGQIQVGRAQIILVERERGSWEDGQVRKGEGASGRGP